MKKYLPIILGILFLVAGLYLYFRHTSTSLPVSDNVMLTRDEAVSVLGDMITDVIKVYENPTSIFDIETETKEDGTTFSNIKNYQEVVSNIFSDKGIIELENTKFNGKNYVIKESDYIYFLSEIPLENRYINSKIKVDMVNIKENEITSQVIFSSSSLDNEGIINYYVITKDIKLVKVEDKWLVEEFKYNNI